MLRITQNSNAKGAKSYYTTADYYSEGQELVGRWCGRGAAMLGLTGTVEKSNWDRLCDNRRPEDGKPLTARRKAERRVGYDLNFHCPKSVSLFYGLTQDSRRTERIERLARERGISDPERKAELGAQTRVGKSKELSMPQLRELWNSRLEEPEANAISRIAASVGTERKEERELGIERSDAARDAVTHAVEHCFERASVVAERGLLARALRLGVGKASRESVERIAAAEPLVRATRSGQQLVTTESASTG